MPPEAQISAAELQDAARRIRALRRAATEHAVEIGRELLRVKARLPHGVFVKWVEKSCEFKIRTAQDLMKLARESEANTNLVALMVPSTLRIYLSRTTPAAVRGTILKRLESGEHVSRSQLCAQLSQARGRGGDAAEAHAVQTGFSTSFLGGPERHGAAESRRGEAADQARLIAELILRRLSPQDYERLMDGLTWEIWNRAFVWMRVARLIEPDGAQGGSAAPAAEPSLELISDRISS